MSPSAAAEPSVIRPSGARCHVALGILVLAFSTLNVLWLEEDSTPMRKGDASAYATSTLTFVDGFDESSLSWWERVAGLSRAGRPPLYQLASAPFVAVFGRSIDSLLAINVVFGALLLVATFGIARVIAGDRAALLAALFVSSYPPVILLSRLYMPHFGLLFWNAATLWMLLLSLEKRSVVAAWLLGAALSAETLTSHYSAFHAPIVVLLAGVYMLLFQTPPRLPGGLRDLLPWIGSKFRDRFVVAGLAPAAVLAGGTTALWYLTEGRRVSLVTANIAKFLDNTGSSFGDSSMGFRDVDASLLWYARTAPEALSWPFALLAALGVLVVLRRGATGAWLALSFLLSYVLLGSLYSPGWYRMAAQLPALAALSAAFLFRLRPAWLKWSAVVVFALVAVFNYGYVSWGSPKSPAGGVAAALGSPMNESGPCDEVYFSMAYCAWPPQPESWHFEEVLELVLEDPRCTDLPCRVGVMPRMPLFKAGVLTRANLEFVNRRDRPSRPVRWAVLGGPWWKRSIGRENFEGYDYILYRVNRQATAPPAEIAAALQLAGPFTPAAEFPQPDGSTLWVLRRTDLEDPVEATEALVEREETIETEGLASDTSPSVPARRSPPVPSQRLHLHD